MEASKQHVSPATLRSWSAYAGRRPIFPGLASIRKRGRFPRGTRRHRSRGAETEHPSRKRPTLSPRFANGIHLPQCPNTTESMVLRQNAPRDRHSPPRHLVHCHCCPSASTPRPLHGREEGRPRRRSLLRFCWPTQCAQPGRLEERTRSPSLNWEAGDQCHCITFVSLKSRAKSKASRNEPQGEHSQFIQCRGHEGLVVLPAVRAAGDTTVERLKSPNFRILGVAAVARRNLHPHSRNKVRGNAHGLQEVIKAIWFWRAYLLLREPLLEPWQRFDEHCRIPDTSHRVSRNPKLGTLLTSGACTSRIDRTGPAAPERGQNPRGPVSGPPDSPLGSSRSSFTSELPSVMRQAWFPAAAPASSTARAKRSALRLSMSDGACPAMTPRATLRARSRHGRQRVLGVQRRQGAGMAKGIAVEWGTGALTVDVARAVTPQPPQTRRFTPCRAETRKSDMELFSIIKNPTDRVQTAARDADAAIAV
ncbi:hypothetical protein DFJ74DRAFT_239944 [Hyaloraphidium curvatum]|nr:hypothetical protein DFJ74DRAFT_239944 [Hyaloraphidium curvatum]